MLADLKQAWRALRGSVRFAAVPVIVLALGMSLNIAVASIVCAILFRSLPVRDPAQLVYVSEVGAGDRWVPIHVPTFRLRTSDIFGGVANLEYRSMALGDGAGIEAIGVEITSANYFDVLGVGAFQGRLLQSSDDTSSHRTPAVILSYDLWTRRFGADSAVIGTLIDLDDRPFQIVGVAPRGFEGLPDVGRPTRAWIAKAALFDDGFSAFGVEPASISKAVVARLRPAMTPEDAAGMLRARAESIKTSRPYQIAGSADSAAYRVLSATSVRTPSDPDADLGFVKAMAASAAIVVLLVLLVACANIVSILTARGIVRRGELAVRQALGASATNIVRQLIAEALILSLLGTILGLAGAYVLIEFLRFVSPSRFLLEIPFDVRVGLIASLLGLAVGMVLGVASARQAVNTSILASLIGGERSGGVAGVRRRLNYGLLVPQIVLSVALLSVAGVEVHALLRAQWADLGLSTDGVFLLRTRRPLPKLPGQSSGNGARGAIDDEAHARARYEEWLRRLRLEPGMNMAALTTLLPTALTDAHLVASIPGSTNMPSRRVPVRAVPAVSAGFFDVLRIRLLFGRDFGNSETALSAPVAIVGESVARMLWPDGTAIGGRLAVGPPDAREVTSQVTWREVVGVVADVHSPVAGGQAIGLVYLPSIQSGDRFMLLTRSAGLDVAAITAHVRNVTDANFPDIGLFHAETLEEEIGTDLYPRRAAAWLVGVSAAAGLILAAVGLYGAMACALARERRALGIRAALGATRGTLTAFVLRDGFRITIAGLLPGLLLGLIGVRVTAHLTGPLPWLDVPTLLITVLVVAAMSLTACYLPLRRVLSENMTEVMRRN